MYAKALVLEITASDFQEFTVVSIPRDDLKTITTSKTSEIADQSGQSDSIPLTWANYLLVEHDQWSSSHEEIIKNAIAQYDAKHPENAIPEDEVIIWNLDRTIELTKGDLLQ